MKRLLRVPMERWTARLSVQPSRPILEAEALLLAALRDTGSLATLAERMNPVPWGILAAMVEDGFISVRPEGEIDLREDLAQARDPVRLVEALAGLQLPHRVTAVIYRDRCTGAWHPPRAVESLAEGPAHDEAHTLPVGVSPGDPAQIAGVEGLVRAALPRLRRLDLGAPRTLLLRTRIEAVSALEAWTAEVIFERHELGDGWEHWLTSADASLAEVCVRAAPHLVLGRKLANKRSTNWSRGPELRVLQQHEAVARHLWHRRKDRELTTDKRLIEEIKQIVHAAREALTELEAEGDDTLRAELARVVPGTGFDQACEMEDILRRAHARVLIFSSFLSPEFADAVVAQIDGALPAAAELLCVYGRATDSGLTEARGEADAYRARLQELGLRSRVRVCPSAVRTHAKIILNDAGDAWIGSWNALSAAPGADVTEVGLRLHGVDVALELLTAVEEMVEEADRPSLAEMKAALRRQRVPRPTLRPEPLAEVREALTWIEAWVPKHFDQQWDQALEERLARVRDWFLDVTERPRVRLALTNEHRGALLALVGQADHSVLVATDRIKPAGLDRQLIDMLAQQPLRIEQKVRFEVRLLWGREDPRFVRREDPDAQAARAQLAKLLAAIQKTRRATTPAERRPRGGPPGFAYDLYTDLERPMCNHAKVLQVDDERLLVTSDNLLVYGDEREATDARELGVLLEAPRQALILRGELELAHPQLRASWDHTRWRVAFAESVRFCAELGRRREVPVGRAMQDMIGRCMRADGSRDEDLYRDMMTRLFETGRGTKSPAEAVVRLVDITSKNCFIDFDRSAYDRIRRDSRRRDVSKDISELYVFLPGPDTVWKRGG